MPKPYTIDFSWVMAMPCAPAAVPAEFSDGTSRSTEVGECRETLGGSAAHENLCRWKERGPAVEISHPTGERRPRLPRPRLLTSVKLDQQTLPMSGRQWQQILTWVGL